VNTLIAYKLLKRRKNGTLGPLYINRVQIIRLNEWLTAEAHRTKGYKYRPGWHCCHTPHAPHIKTKPERIWAMVEIKKFEEFNRPIGQGGLWYIAQQMKIIGFV
jgi:hypothetical protein